MALSWRPWRLWPVESALEYQGLEVDMAIRTGLITAEELARLPEEDAHVELVRGELVRMAPAGLEHGTIAQVCVLTTEDTSTATISCLALRCRSGTFLNRANRYGQRYGTPPGRRRNSSPSRPSRTSPPSIGRSSRA